MKDFKSVFWVLIVGFLVVGPVRGQTASESEQEAASATRQSHPSKDLKVLESLDYPELQVVPRATQRLTLEAAEEKKNFWYVHWPFYGSALATILSAQQQQSNLKADLESKERSDAKDRLTISSAIGTAWLVGMVVLSFDRPYQKGKDTVEKIGGRSKETALMRERIAEETFETPARLISKLKWISVVSNFVANSVALDEVNTDGQVYAGVGILASFLPLVFEHTYTYNYEKHQEYKRKIYAPNIHLDTYQVQKTRFAQSDWVKRINLTWTF